MRVFFKYWKSLSIKNYSQKKSERITFNSASITNQTNIYWGLKNKKIRRAYHTSCNWKLIISYFIQAKDKVLYQLNPNWLERYIPNYTLFLFCSTITTQLPSTSLKSELQFWPISELGIFHTLALNFKDWLFDVIVTRHFRPKSVHLNESVYCKPIDRTLKMLFIEESHSFLRPIIPGLWKLLVLG